MKIAIEAPILLYTNLFSFVISKVMTSHQNCSIVFSLELKPPHYNGGLLFPSCPLSSSFHLDGWHVSRATPRLCQISTHVVSMLTLARCCFCGLVLIVLSIVHVYSCWEKIIKEILSTENALVRFLASIWVLELHYFWTKQCESCINSLCVNRCYFCVLGLASGLATGQAAVG